VGCVWDWQWIVAESSSSGCNWPLASTNMHGNPQQQQE